MRLDPPKLAALILLLPLLLLVICLLFPILILLLVLGLFFPTVRTSCRTFRTGFSGKDPRRSDPSQPPPDDGEVYDAECTVLHSEPVAPQTSSDHRKLH